MFTFTITPDGEESFRVTASSRDLVQWERRNKSASLTALREQMRMTDLYKIAYIAAVRQHFYDGTEQEFNDSCDLELEEEDEGGDEEVPTRSAA